MTLAEKEFALSKVMAGAIIGLLSWNIYTTYQLSIDVAVLTEKITSIERIVNK